MATDKHIDIRLTQSQANLILIGLEDLFQLELRRAKSFRASESLRRQGRPLEIEKLMDMIMDAGLDAGFGDVQS